MNDSRRRFRPRGFESGRRLRPGDYIEDSVGNDAEDADWCYTQLTLTF